MDLIVGVGLVPFCNGAPASVTLWINERERGISPNQTAGLWLLIQGTGNDTDGKSPIGMVTGNWIDLCGRLDCADFLRNTGEKLRKSKCQNSPISKGWYRTCGDCKRPRWKWFAPDFDFWEIMRLNPRI